MEFKSTVLNACEVKFAKQEPGFFTGYGAVFNNLDFKDDIIMPGAFAEVLKIGDPVDVYINHGWLRGELPVGRWNDLQEDTKGLIGEAALMMQMPSAQDAYWSVKGELARGLSIGFVVHPNGYDYNLDGHRIIHRMQKLKEISITTEPANEKTQIVSVKFKNDIEKAETERDIEDLLRETGLNKIEIKALLSRVKNILTGNVAPSDVEAKSMATILDRLKQIG